MRVYPGASASTFLLSCFGKAFPQYFTQTGAIKEAALISTVVNWRAHNRMPQNILKYIVLDIQHKTLPQVLPFKLYVFEDFTSPDILLSYPTSSRVGIVEFKVPNESTTFLPAILDAITSPKTGTFSTHLEDTP